MTTTDLSKFGFRELAIAGELLTAMTNNGLPKDFDDDGVTVMFNTHSGNVFLTNSEYHVAMLDGEGGLESYYVTPYDGIEGTLEELIDEYGNLCEEDKEFVDSLREMHED